MTHLCLRPVYYKRRVFRALLIRGGGRRRRRGILRRECSQRTPVFNCRITYFLVTETFQPQLVCVLIVFGTGSVAETAEFILSTFLTILGRDRYLREETLCSAVF